MTNQEKFKNQVKRGILLRDYCKSNNIILLEYKYDLQFYKLSELIKSDLNKIKNNET